MLLYLFLYCNDLGCFKNSIFYNHVVKSKEKMGKTSGESLKSEKQKEKEGKYK